MVENKERIKSEFNKKASEDKIYLNYRKNHPSDRQYYQIIKSLKKNKKVLSLGCGEGREVRELVKDGHKVTAVDFAEKMIENSKKNEPNAKYVCEDVVEFTEKNNHKKFDYIIGLFSLLNYIDAQKRRKTLIENLKMMIKPDGEIILTAHFASESLKDLIRVIIAPIYALIFGEIKDYRFRDNYSKVKGYWIRCHMYTRKEINTLFKGFNIKYRKIWHQTEIRINKK